MEYRLLIAAANPEDAARLETAFSNRSDYTVVGVVSTAADALDCIRNEEVTVLLSDQYLPDMDGIALFEQAALLHPDRKLSIFAMSVLPDDRLLRILCEHIVYCFVKPIDPMLITLRMSEILNAMSLIAPVQPTPIEILNQKISEYLLAVGVPVHLKGYYYLRDAIRLYALSKSPVDINITTDIYPKVADLYQTRSMLVEHAMRNAIEIAWTRGNLDAIISLFGYTVNDHKGKPSNLEFVAMIAERVRMNFASPGERRAKTVPSPR